MDSRRHQAPKTAQRYESADNKEKHQAIINDNMRRKNEVQEQFSMTDPNVERMLKQIKKNNYMTSDSTTQSQMETGSTRKRKAMQEQQLYQESYNQQVNNRSSQQPVIKPSSREQRKNDRERSGAHKKQYS